MKIYENIGIENIKKHQKHQKTHQKTVNKCKQLLNVTVLTWKVIQFKRLLIHLVTGQFNKHMGQ